jgi:hypothetical protein
MAMKTGCQMLVLAMMVIPAGFARSDEKPPADNKLAILERFVGEWEVDGKWSDGSTLHGRSVYEWGLSKKILNAKSFVRDGDKEYQRYESVFAWYPEKKSLYGITFAFDGAISEYLMESKDENTLQIGWTSVSPDKPSKLRQVIKFLDKDHFQWVVSVKDGDEWKQIMDATWKRKVKP